VNLRDQLIRNEGCVLTAYKDTLGYWTVGVGHKVASNVYLGADIKTAIDQLEAALPWTQTISYDRTGPNELTYKNDAAADARFDALVNMAFNMGIHGLLQFHHFLGYMESGHWSFAAREMLNSLWAKQVGDRAHRLSAQVLTGVMQ
jgi:lysozyme